MLQVVLRAVRESAARRTRMRGRRGARGSRVLRRAGFAWRGRAAQKWVPPSTRISVPVMNLPSSLASIATTDATVSGSANP
ncbi:hypothetical protein GCM10010524_37810 [Streptomyces mexicanus]